MAGRRILPYRGRMGTARERVVTDHGILVLVDGIVVERVHPIESTPELIEEEFAAIEALSGGSPPPLLLDVRAWQGGGLLAWKEALGRLRGAVSAIAFLTDEDTEVLGPWPSVIDQLLVPAAVFTDEGEAMGFLARERDRDPTS